MRIRKLIIHRLGSVIRKAVGFTLIELLIVVSILAILSGMALFSYLNTGKSTRDVQRKHDLSQIQAALGLYYADNGGYPPVTGTAGDQIDWGNFQSKYITKVPTDPLSTQKYSYQPDKTTYTTYKLYAKLEDCKDPQANASGCSDPCNCSADYNYCASPTGPCK